MMNEIKRLLNKIEYIPTTGCWLFIGAMTKYMRTIMNFKEWSKKMMANINKQINKELTDKMAKKIKRGELAKQKRDVICPDCGNGMQKSWIEFDDGYWACAWFCDCSFEENKIAILGGVG